MLLQKKMETSRKELKGFKLHTVFLILLYYWFHPELKNIGQLEGVVWETRSHAETKCPVLLSVNLCIG